MPHRSIDTCTCTVDSLSFVGYQLSWLWVNHEIKYSTIFENAADIGKIMKYLFSLQHKCPMVQYLGKSVQYWDWGHYNWKRKDQPLI